MKPKHPVLLVLVISGLWAVSALAQPDGNSKQKAKITEANVWVTEDGKKHFTCPVMGGEGVVDSNTVFSDVDGKRYYHCCAGCTKKFKANPSKYLEDFVVPGNVVKVDDKGKHFICPVSGEEGIVSEKSLYSDWNGKRYYFCCAGCKPRFEADSEKYLKPEGKKSGAKKMEHKK